MIRVYRYHACRNRPCALFMLQAPGAEPGICPRCGWQRVLAAITTLVLR